MLFDSQTRACGARIWSGCTTAALLLISILAAPAAWAHVDPPGSNATGITASITAFRADGTTFVLPGTVTQCETIFYRATLQWAGSAGGQINAAFEGGNSGETSWTITTPDGQVHDVLPAGGIPCVGGTEDDPISGANDDRGLCNGSATFFDSELVEYTVSVNDIAGGEVQASTVMADAYAHISVSDNFPAGANTIFPLTVELCDDAQFCNGAETCNPDATSTDGVRKGLCEPGTPPVCDDGVSCTIDSCDEGIDACVNTPDDSFCDDGLWCNGDETCDVVNDCQPGTPEDCSGLDDECNEGVCDEGSDSCVQDPLPPEVAPPECFPSFICRTPGFWGTHAADPKRGDVSIVEDILDWGGPLMVCGQMLDTSYVDPLGSTPSNSTTEAICVSPKGAQELQLARHLAAMALNCRISGGELTPEQGENLCTGTFVDELFGACDAACQDMASPYTVSECIEMVDCINNGGDLDTATGMCLGTVSEDNCHTRDLCPDGADFCYEPPGPASSPKDCNAANKNDIYIIDANVNSGGRN